jgi:hypothetical protein
MHWAEFANEFYALGELDRVVGGERLASSPGPRNGPEWDGLRLMNQRTLRRLRGAGWMISGGMQPDQLTEVIVPRVADVELIDEAIEWYVRTCLVAIAEARLVAQRQRHRKLAVRNGHRTYYDYRTALAQEQGYESLWHMRKAKGWT